MGSINEWARYFGGTGLVSMIGSCGAIATIYMLALVVARTT